MESWIVWYFIMDLFFKGSILVWMYFNQNTVELLMEIIKKHIIKNP